MTQCTKSSQNEIMSFTDTYEVAKKIKEMQVSDYYKNQDSHYL